VSGCAKPNDNLKVVEFKEQDSVLLRDFDNPTPLKDFTRQGKYKGVCPKAVFLVYHADIHLDINQIREKFPEECWYLIPQHTNVIVVSKF
jgi:hypothetical protein